jgi:hypoxanthine phosphoribosyltransferase
LVSLDYVGFHIADVFVVGYGLDMAQHYRNLREIRVLDAG